MIKISQPYILNIQQDTFPRFIKPRYALLAVCDTPCRKAVSQNRNRSAGMYIYSFRQKIILTTENHKTEKRTR